MNDKMPTSLRSLFPFKSLGDQQRARERLMVESAIQQYHDRLTAASLGKHENSTFYGRELIERYISRAADAVRAELQSEKENEVLRDLQRLVSGKDCCAALAYFTLWNLFACITTRSRVTQTCYAVGRTVDMWRLTEWDRREANSARASKKTLAVAPATHRPLRWEAKKRTEVGLYLIETLNDALGLFEKEEDKTARRGTRSGQLYFVPSDDLTLYVDLAKERGEARLDQASGWPMCVPPRRWRDAFRGGYLTQEARRRFPLLKRSRTLAKVTREEASRCLSPEVLEAVNIVQRTAYRVNAWLLEQMKEARRLQNSGRPRAVAPDHQLLPRWMPKSTRPQRRKGARGHEARKLKEARHKWDEEAEWNNPQFLKMDRLLSQATHNAAFERIFLPCYLDYRGRLYYRPELSPQGDKAARALLEASDGCTISTPEGLRWLKIHVANCFGHGEERKSYEERIAWVDDHHEEIVAAGSEPWGSDWWIKQFGDDKWAERWLFLAACHEYASYCLHGQGFKSHAIIYLDGTCNGMQHLSAIGRDELAGYLVNLSSKATREDIYQKVWSLTEAALGTLAHKSGKDGVCARAWREIKGDRELVKPIVMNFPNGVSDSSAKRYLRQKVRAKLKDFEKGTATPFSRCAKYDMTKKQRSRVRQSDRNWLGCQVAIDWLYESVLKKQVLRNLLSRATLVRAFLRDLAAVAAVNDMPVEWNTPDGFLVRQHCVVMRYHLAQVQFSKEKRLTARLRARTARLGKQRQKNAIVPNFVHSLDATALRSYVRSAAGQGVSVFALAHDCYGCRIAEVADMRRAIAAGFVFTHENGDLLALFRNSVAAALPANHKGALPSVPEQGNLELSSVLDSEYFFS
jgi:DNA-directed RNA polymerase